MMYWLLFENKLSCELRVAGMYQQMKEVDCVNLGTVPRSMSKRRAIFEMHNCVARHANNAAHLVSLQ